MYLKIRKFPCVRAHRGNLINYMRTDTKDLLTNRFGGNKIKQYVCAVIVFLEFPRNYVHDYLVPNAFYVKTPKDKANILISFSKTQSFLF